ncbi:gene transfer agent family protein [Aquamicrobium soli]|uniref:Gene transfer agent family protein n=1 Tax=Aquamicrobium soli TaxID=1811518 RepID=A0ABV7KIV9_9HYPH
MRPVTAEWLGRRHTFRLPLGGIFAIEDECGKPAWTVLGDMLAGRVRMEQLEAVLFHGLLGAGMSIAEAAAVLDDTRRSGGQVAAAVALCIAVLANALDAPQAKGGGEGEPFNRKSAYRSGFAMGMRPADVDAMSLREFLAAVEAFTSKSGGLSEAERDELWEWIREGGG